MRRRLFVGNLLVHAEALGWWTSAAAGNRLGIATLLMLITLVGGRIVPSFTRNWLARRCPAPCCRPRSTPSTAS